MNYLGITFASDDQEIDNGASVIHLAPETSSNMNIKSIVKGSGKNITRNVIYVSKEAENIKSTSDCQAILLDDISVSDTIPVIDTRNKNANIGYEAKIGSLDDSKIYYLMSRGISEEDAKAMIVRGFAEPISKALPIEYAVEMNRLIDLELEGAIG